MLMTIAIVLVILWLAGLLGHVAGGFINLVLLIALIVFVYDFVVKRRRV
jgi:hypothetical protein